MTGLSIPAFEQIVNNFQETYSAMAACFEAGTVQAWQPSVYEGHNAVDCYARYFTTRRHAPTETNLEFGPGVDPDGILAQLRGQDLIHGADNKVAYLHRMEEGNRVRYVAMEPRHFQAGDIVEASIAFVCIPVREKRYMIPQLRGLTLLDSSVRQTMIESRVRERTVVRGKKTLKRKLLYASEEEETPSKRLAMMQIQ